MIRRRALGFASAVSLALASSTMAVWPATPAAAATLSCGATITANTTLANDVGPCASTAITFGADNITLNLNGHTVFGTSAAQGTVPGILGSGTNGDTVKNGRVTGFDTGVYFEFGSGETITNLNVHDNIGAPDGNGIFGEGIQLFQTNNTTISSNIVTHNGTFAGIDLFDASGNTVSRNIVRANNVLQPANDHCGVPGVQQDIGIWVVFLTIPTTQNVVTGNTVADSGLDGIQVSRFANGNTVTRNVVTRNGFGQVLNACRDGDGIVIFGNSNLVQANTSTASAARGIDVERSTNRAGVPVGGQGNQILNNVAVGSGKGINSAKTGFDLTDTNLTPPCDSNVWSRNTFITFNQRCVTK